MYTSCVQSNPPTEPKRPRKTGKKKYDGPNDEDEHSNEEEEDEDANSNASESDDPAHADDEDTAPPAKRRRKAGSAGSSTVSKRSRRGQVRRADSCSSMLVLICLCSRRPPRHLSPGRHDRREARHLR